MARRINKDGVDRLMTTEEEADFDKGLASSLKGKPLNDWNKNLNKARANMPDHLEAIWDAVGISDASQEVKDAYSTKKAAKTGKPT
jgi:hypothetical protein